MVMLWRFKDMMCNINVNFFIFFLVVQHILGFQLEKSYSNQVLKGQKHRSGFWFAKKLDSEEM